jgi:monovalent cation:H+ antiporter-2, CPA2 family
VEAAGREERDNGAPEPRDEPVTSSVEIPAERPERPVRQRDPEY